MSNYLKNWKVIISVVLAILTAIMLPVEVFAQAAPKHNPSAKVKFDSLAESEDVGEIVAELKERRDEYTKHFRMDDGTIMAVVYDVPVHYKNKKGKWIDYDNTLVSESTASPDEASQVFYSNKKSKLDIDFTSETSGDNLITLNSSKGSISWEYIDAKKSKIKIDKSKKRLRGNDRFTSIDKLSSKACYKSIYDKVNLDCIVSTVGVKENIILQDKSAQNEFNIKYNIKGFTAKQTDKQTVKLYKGKKEVYSITAPCMYDSGKKTSTNLSLEIIGNKAGKLSLKLTADKDFLNNAKYPVTIDPEVTIVGDSNTETAHVNASSPDSTQSSTMFFYVGNNNGNYSGLVKCKNISNQFAGKNIVSAKLNLFPMNLSSAIDIEAYAITSSWSNGTATYNNVSHDSEVLDYTSLGSNSSDKITFDLTKTFKKWVNGTQNNNGVYLKSNNSFRSFGGHLCYLPERRPTYVVKYKEYTGSESNLTSHSASCGTNTSASVCDYTGSLTVKHNIYEEVGEKIPYSIYATYHNTRKDVDEGAGAGWHMSFYKTLSLADNYYTFLDEDGVLHYFEADDSGSEIYAEDESDYTLSVNENLIEVSNGEIVHIFDVPSEGQTKKIKREHYVGNSELKVTYTYSNGLLSEITTPINHYFISYATTTNQVSKRVSSISSTYTFPTTNFSYYSGNYNSLNYISNNNGEKTVFHYDNKNIYYLYNTSTKNGTTKYGQEVSIVYNNNKVSNITQKGSNSTSSSYTTGNYLNITYDEGNSTTFTDNSNKEATYTFDDYGNTVSILNENGYIENVENSEELSVTSGCDSHTKNLIDISSEPDSIGNDQYYKSGNGTIGSQQSSGGTVSIDTEKHCLGSKSIKINHSGESQIYTYAMHDNLVGDLANKTVTLSAYVHTANMSGGSLSGEKGAIVKFKAFNGSATVKDVNSAPLLQTLSGAEWQRLSLTVKVPSNTTKYRIYFGIRNAQGSAWFDCMQLEKNDTMNDYNALYNSDFTSGSGWQTQNGGSITVQNGNAVLTGTGGGNPYIEPNNGEEETENTDSTQPTTAEPTTQQVAAEAVTEIVDYDSISNEDSSGNVIEEKQGKVINHYIKYTVPEDNTPEVTEEEEEETQSTTDPESSDCNNYIYQTIPVNRCGICFNVSGTASANSVPLTVGDRSFAIGLIVHYEDGTTDNFTTSFNSSYSGEQCVSESFTPEDTSKLITTVDFAFLYGYNKGTMIVKNAMLNFADTSYDIESINFSANEEEPATVDPNTSAEPDDDVEDEEDEDYETELVSQEIDTSSPYMQTNKEYDNKGNYQTKEYDYAGNQTSYNYNSNGNISGITDAKGHNISYSYNSKNDLTSVWIGDNETQYSYDGFSNLSSIKRYNIRNNTSINYSYDYTYDKFNNLSSTKIGNRTLVSETYGDNDGNLTQTSYGNGADYTYEYDDYNRISKVKLNNTTIAEYYYNKKGKIARVVDNKVKPNASAKPETTTYEYDYNGNLIYTFKSSSEVLGAYRSYYKPNGEYVKVNNVYGFKQTVAEGTDQAGNEYVKYGNNYVKMTKEADQFGRTTVINEKKSYNNISFKTEFTYKGVAGNSNRKTDLINTFKQSYDNNILANLFYKYDANNNITEVKSNSNNSTMYAYSYNSRDELHSFTDYINRDYYTYTYDEAGNILSKNHQNLNEGNAPVGTVTTTSYEYNNSEWQDLLTKYGNDSITYDTIGNPLNYRSGMTMPWSGRDLTSITKSGDTYSYTYNINGYRTKKIANGNTYYYYYDSDNKLIGMQTGVHTYVFYYDNEGKIHSMEENGDYYYFVKNAEGDVIAITNHHGTPIVKYTYDAWGKTTSVKDNNGQDISTTSYYAKTIPFRFRGYAYDNESGLYYLNSRYYDPETGRFINADSYVDTESGTPMSTNMFAYCENNPVMGYDPEGTWDIFDHKKICDFAEISSKQIWAWDMRTDYCFPSNDKTKMSSPFHSRKNIELTQILYNAAIELKKSTKGENASNKMVDFCFSKSKKTKFDKKNGKYCLPECYCAYRSKKGSKKVKKNSKESKKILNYLNGSNIEDDDKNIIYNSLENRRKKHNKTVDWRTNYYNILTKRVKNRNDQAKALMGLALHSIQDYFAHKIKIYYSTKRNTVKNLNKKHKKMKFITDVNNEELEDVKTSEFEDKRQVFSWRYDEAEFFTYDIFNNYYVCNDSINSIILTNVKKTKLFSKKLKLKNSKKRKYYFIVRKLELEID